MKLSFVKKAGKGLLIASFAVSMAFPSTAFALTNSEDPNIPSAALKTTDYVRAAATRAAMPSIEILGAASVEESGNFVDTSDYFNWSQPKYMLTASYYNESPSPLLANLGTGFTSESNPDNYESAVYHSSRSGGGAGPDSALAAYVVNSADSESDSGSDSGSDSDNDSGSGSGGSSNAEEANDNEVWDLLPEVIVGDGDGVNYAATGYAPTVSGKSYIPVGVDYSFSDYTSLCDTMDAIASALDAAVSDTQTLRFDSTATSIAQSYRKYIFGTLGYIQQLIDDKELEVRTVALVEDIEYDDEGNLLFDLMTDEEAGAGDGTAATNRYLETTSASGLEVYGVKIAVNYASAEEDSADSDTGDNEGSSDSDEGSGEDGRVLVTASELQSSNVDLIMVGGQQSSSNYSDIVEALFKSGLLGKTYLVENNGSAGAMYGVVMNSVENAQNIGRILGCLYSDVIDQQSWLAYYYEEFYHIKSANLYTVMDNALDGVRNWAVKSSNAATAAEAIADFTDWDLTTDYTSNYCKKKVQDAISDGYTYYKNLVTNSNSGN